MVSFIMLDRHEHVITTYMMQLSGIEWSN